MIALDTCKAYGVVLQDAPLRKLYWMARGVGGGVVVLCITLKNMYSGAFSSLKWQTRTVRRNIYDRLEVTFQLH